jgi:SAM-dependent methyltransferase
MRREDWNERYAGTDRLWSAEPNQFLVEETAEVAPGRALDLACGEGRNAIWLAQRGWSVDAVDYSGVALRKARRLAVEKGVEVRWIELDLETHTPAEKGYDMVIVFYLHLPWEAMRPVLHRAAAAVAPRGTFLLVGHDLTNLEHGHAGPQSPAVLYTPDRIAGELPGLEIVAAARRDRPVETDAGSVTAIDCLVRAVAPVGDIPLYP